MASSLVASGARSPLTTRIAAIHPLPLALAVLTVLSQIGYPLTSGVVRDRLTVVTVLLWTAASLAHAVITRGARFAAALLTITAGIGFGAEAVGVATGEPFGHYRYAASLGPRVAGVPLLVPLAWVMMAYPALLVGRRIGTPILGGALALASWDLFLDPQMVDAHHWQFIGPSGRTSIGLNGIPLSNTVGWIIVSLVIMSLLVRIPERAADAHDDRVPLGLYFWTYASSVLAAAVFFDRPGVAVAGGLAMGIPTVLLARTLVRRRP